MIRRGFCHWLKVPGMDKVSLRSGNIISPVKTWSSLLPSQSSVFWTLISLLTSVDFLPAATGLENSDLISTKPIPGEETTARQEAMDNSLLPTSQLPSSFHLCPALLLLTHPLHHLLFPLTSQHTSPSPEDSPLRILPGAPHMGSPSLLLVFSLARKWRQDPADCNLGAPDTRLTGIDRHLINDLSGADNTWCCSIWAAADDFD